MAKPAQKNVRTTGSATLPLPMDKLSIRAFRPFRKDELGKSSGFVPGFRCNGETVKNNVGERIECRASRVPETEIDVGYFAPSDI
jgi:hypothetical protein